MYEILAYKKETENKLRWDADVDETKFEFYIPKWRIPEPYPDTILIRIGMPDEFENKRRFTKEEVEKNPELRKNKIYAEVEKVSEHTKTVRFDPVDETENWEIGSPYIPKVVLDEINEVIDYLSLSVEWC